MFVWIFNQALFDLSIFVSKENSSSRPLAANERRTNAKAASWAPASAFRSHQVSCFEICFSKDWCLKWNSEAVLNFTLSNQSSTLDWSTPLLHHHLEEHPRHLAASRPPNTSLRHVACFHFCPEPIQRSLLLLTSWSWYIRGFVDLCVYSCFFLVFLVCVFVRLFACLLACLFACLLVCLLACLFDFLFPPFVWFAFSLLVFFCLWFTYSVCFCFLCLIAYSKCEHVLLAAKLRFCPASFLVCFLFLRWVPNHHRPKSRIGPSAAEMIWVGGLSNGVHIHPKHLKENLAFFLQ